MKTCLITILLIVTFSIGSSVFAGVCASITTEEIDGLYVSTITLSSDIGSITSIDFSAEGNLIDYDIEFPPGAVIDTLYNDMPLPEPEYKIDSRMLFNRDEVIELFGTDSSQKLAAVLSGFDPFTERAIARVSTEDDVNYQGIPSSVSLNILAVVDGKLYDTLHEQSPTCGQRARFGDFNCDTLTNLTDLTILGEHYNQPGDYNDGDTNSDFVVDLLDLVQLGNHYNDLPCDTYNEGDIDCDGLITLTDLVTLAENYNTATPRYMSGDADGSGFVDLVDFDIMINQPIWSTHIPEPGAVGLLGLGGLLVISRRR